MKIANKAHPLAQPIDDLIILPKPKSKFTCPITSAISNTHAPMTHKTINQLEFCFNEGDKSLLFDAQQKTSPASNDHPNTGATKYSAPIR